MARVPAGMGRPARAVTCMRRRQGIPAPPTGLAMEDLREPMPSSMAAASTVEASTVGMEGIEAGTGDRIRRC
ncbi:MAG: hypothetical protein QOH31_3879 [Verrucomicrobiota bacterium]|jgi:hypothetical protein